MLVGWSTAPIYCTIYRLEFPTKCAKCASGRTRVISNLSREDEDRGSLFVYQIYENVALGLRSKILVTRYDMTLITRIVVNDADNTCIW